MANISLKKIFSIRSEGVEWRVRARGRPRFGATILIVDDSSTVVFALRRMLEQNGYLTLVAYDAESAINLARAHQPDLIFMDVVLPGMNGFEATRRLRKQPDTMNTPIVVMSGNQMATERFWVIRIGANDFMTKPFTRRDVFERVERSLNKSQVA
jgi:twitching motility two-component system response regulator PilH